VKVSIDQGIQAPAMLALIISGLAFMEGRGWDGISSDMQQQYVDALIQNWKLWIPATVVNIAFVKPALRVLYDNLVFFVWTIYLSMILNEVPTQV
jgi:peroxisomal membrane protein 2